MATRGYGVNTPWQDRTYFGYNVIFDFLPMNASQPMGEQKGNEPVSDYG